MKTELAALDRKIQLSLKPVDQNGENNSQKNSVQQTPPHRGGAKEMIDDRLTVGSIPKYNENQSSKGFKL
jgi:hypothetical protein